LNEDKDEQPLIYEKTKSGAFQAGECVLKSMASLWRAKSQCSSAGDSRVELVGAAARWINYLATSAAR
jgi:hypothetical protein